MTPMHSPSTPRPSPSFLTYRQSILSLAKIVGLLLTYTLQAAASSFSTLPATRTLSPTPTVSSIHHKPTSKPLHHHHTGHTSLEILKSHAEIDDTPVWLYFFVAAMLVLLGGAFAGLTIALMGQDEIYLQVIATSEEGPEKKHANKVLRLLKKGKHWVLVTLLLSNVITNETLPIVLDRSLGGGWPAVLGSTVAIVIFGEIIPQSICVRYGLSIGAFCAPFVLALMYLMGPVAWPIAKLLDKLLGEEHGTTYKKAGLKTLVTLHRSLGEAGERLNADEVTIISAVLDLKNKPVGNIMTPIEDVFTMSEDTILDEKTMEMILSAGYSRIPIHRPESPTDFVGMLLVKALIVYDPEDAKPVRDFALATLPETFPETSCLDIVNFFQEGKSHMVLVSESPGDTTGALGVVTLEDVIEELIGEEIIDESDVFIDVHKAIRRMAPAPRLRLPKRTAEVGSNDEETQALLIDIDDNTDPTDPRRHSVSRNLTFAGDTKPPGAARYSLDGSRPQFRGFYSARRSSSTTGRADDAMSKRSTSIDVRERLRHLGPSNKASDPKTTKYANVKIKPGTGTARNSIEPRRLSMALSDGGLGLNAGLPASDGVQAISNATLISPIDDNKPTNLMDSIQTLPVNAAPPPRLQEESIDISGSPMESTVGSLPSNSRWASKNGEDRSRSRGVARSGSITENIVEHDGIRKVVLQTCCSESDEDEELSKEETEAMRDARDRLGDEGHKGSHRSRSHSHAHEHDKTSKKHHHHYTTVDADSRSHSHSHSHSHHNGHSHHSHHSHSHSNGHASRHRSSRHKHDEHEHAIKDPSPVEEANIGERVRTSAEKKQTRRRHRSRNANGHGSDDEDDRKKEGEDRKE